MRSHPSPHSYVSIRSGGVRSYGVPRGRGSIVFVDLSSAAQAERIRELPPMVLREPRAKLLFRLADDTGAEELEAILKRWALPMQAALLSHPLGEAPALRALDGGEIPELDVAAARAIELEALLEWGKAIWRPQRYHFVSPLVSTRLNSPSLRMRSALPATLALLPPGYWSGCTQERDS